MARKRRNQPPTSQPPPTTTTTTTTTAPSTASSLEFPILHRLFSAPVLSQLAQVAQSTLTATHTNAQSEFSRQNRQFQKRKRESNEAQTENYATGFSDWAVADSETGHNLEGEVIDNKTDQEEETTVDLDTALTRTLKDAEIWSWQYECELSVYNSLVQNNSEQLPDNDTLQLAIAQMWEPHRGYYGEYGWWAWDQRDSLDSTTTERPPKFFRVDTECEIEREETEMVEDAAEEGEDVNVEVQSHPIEATPTPVPIDLNDLLPNAKKLRNRSSNYRDDDDVLIGMEVEKDLVYDESELTPEEIEIQRWSIAWKAKRAAELKAEQESHSQSLKTTEAALQQAQTLSLTSQTYAYKSKTYPTIYGASSHDIILLEAKIQQLFEASGGVGSVPDVIPVGEIGEEFYTRRKRPIVLLRASAMSPPSTTIKQTSSHDAVEEPEEGELEEGEMEEDGEVAQPDEGYSVEDCIPESDIRVLWPVLPIRS